MVVDVVVVVAVRMGSGTMAVFCFVVDFDRAKSVIEESLKGTEFSDYSRICNEDEDEDAEEDGPG